MNILKIQKKKLNQNWKYRDRNECFRSRYENESKLKLHKPK